MRRASVACLLVLLAASGEETSAQSQTGITQWQFESVAAAPTTCPPGLNLVGFDHDPAGNPILAWQQDCTLSGAPPRVFWARKAGGTWPAHEYISDRRYQGGGDGDVNHALIVLPGDGTPILVFTAPGASNELNTYSVNLDASLSGAASVYLENLAGAQTGVTAAYAPAAEAIATATGGGQLATGFYFTNDLGSVRINGATVSTTQVYRPRVAFAVAPDTSQHLLWSTGTTLYYTTRAPRAPAFQTRTLYTSLEKLGGEVKLTIDGSGVLHALVRGYDPDSSFDGGTLVYFNSTDNGVTWSTPEYIDPFDAVPANPGVHANISLAVDASGVPAVTYWKSQQQLIYARRDGAGGTWTRSVVATRPNVTASRTAFVDFDATGNPVVAYFDQPSNRLLLARPVPQGVVVPVDLALTGVVSPATMAGGGPLTYTLTVENQGTTTVTNATLALHVPPGVTLGTATPATPTPGVWSIASLPAYTTTTIVVSATAPLLEGDVVATATIGSRATDADPTDDAVVLPAAVRNLACFVPTSGLAGLFRGDRNADNDIASEADGVAKGGVSYTPAAVGDGFLVNGTDGVVSVQANNENAFYPGTGSFTVQAFVRTTSAQPQMVASRYECVSPYCGLTTWYLQITNGFPNVFVRDRAGTSLSVIGTKAVNDGAMHHVGFVIDRAASALRLYIDGVRDTSQPFTLGDMSHDIPRTTPLLIGAFQQTNGTLFRYFNGVIDELAIARRAYSDAEMAQIAAILSGAACAVLPAPGSGADVAAALSVTPIDVAASGAIEYVLRATNLGAGTANAVSLTHQLPAGAALVSAIPPGQPAGPDTSTYAVGPLAGGASAWVVVQATAPPAPGPATSTVTTSSASDGNATNDTASATVVVTRGACILVPVGLVANWPLNGTLADLVGPHAGVLRGTATFIPGRVSAGLALRLDGAGSVEVPDAAGLRPAQFTLGAWVSPEFQAPGVPLAILSKGSSDTDPLLPAGAYTWWLGAVDGLASFSVRQGAGTITLQGRTDISGDWHHVAASYDGTTVRLYVDGVEEDTRVLTLPLHYDTGSVPLVIGDLTGTGSSQRFFGLVDDVTLHGRALGPTEVQALVNGPSASCLANTAPTLAQPADRVNAQGDSVVLQLQATDANADPLTFAAVNLPPGLTIDPSYGLINGTVTTRGVYTVTIYATDGIDVAQATFTWTVQGNSPPNLTSGFPPIDREGAAVSRALKTLVNASDPDNDPLTFTVTGLPPGLSFSNATGLVTGTLPYGTAGTYPVVISADDGAGGTAAVTVTWTVQPQIPLLIDVVEAVVVVDATAVLPSVFIDVPEAVTVADAVQVTPAVFIDLAEQVSVDDQLAVTPATVIDVVEQVTVSDSAALAPAVFISVDERVAVQDTLAPAVFTRIVVQERIAVTDAVMALPRVRVVVMEPITVADGVQARLPLHVRVVEQVAVSDTTMVLPPLHLTVAEQIAVTDVAVAKPSVRLAVVERVAVSDSAVLRPALRVAVLERVAVTDGMAARPPVRVAVPEPVRVVDVARVAVGPNRPPVALAKPVTAPAGASCVATVLPSMVDNGSFDPDGDPIALSLLPPGPFSRGRTNVQLTVTDSHGLASTTASTVTVADGIKPVVSASLTRVGPRAASTYLVTYTASDNCAPPPAVTAVMTAPVATGFSTQIVNLPNATTTFIFFDRRRRTIQGFGPRAQVQQLVAQIAAGGGVPVVSGQVVALRATPSWAGLYQYQFVNGVLVAMATPERQLTVQATDASGNTSTAIAYPVP